VRQLWELRGGDETGGEERLALVASVCEARIARMGEALTESEMRRHSTELEMEGRVAEEATRAREAAARAQESAEQAIVLQNAAAAAAAEAEAKRQRRVEAERRAAEAAELAEAAAERAAAAAAQAEEARAAEAAAAVGCCCICLVDELPRDDGVTCAHAHFVCGDCLQAHVAHFGRRSLAERADGRVPCPEPGCRAADGARTSYPDALLALRLPGDAFNAYLASRLQLEEARLASEVDGRVRRQVQAELARLAEFEDDRDGREADALQRHIVDEILTLKCPREGCRQAYDDFEGCAALVCSRCRDPPCHFCGWCLHDCGRDAHAHVRTCPHKPAGTDAYYPRPRAVFDDHWKRRKAARIAEAMEAARPAVRARVCRALRVQLDEVGYGAQ